MPSLFSWWWSFLLSHKICSLYDLGVLLNRIFMMNTYIFSFLFWLLFRYTIEGNDIFTFCKRLFISPIFVIYLPHYRFIGLHYLRSAFAHKHKSLAHIQMSINLMHMSKKTIWTTFTFKLPIPFLAIGLQIKSMSVRRKQCTST